MRVCVRTRASVRLFVCAAHSLVCLGELVGQLLAAAFAIEHLLLQRIVLSRGLLALRLRPAQLLPSLLQRLLQLLRRLRFCR